MTVLIPVICWNIASPTPTINAGRRRGASSADQGTNRPSSRRRSVRNIASSPATSAGDARSRRSTASAFGHAVVSGQPARAFRQYQHPDGQYRARHRTQPEHPAPAIRRSGEGVTHQVGHQDTQRDAELVERGHCCARRRERFQPDKAASASKPRNRDADQEPPRQQHPDVFRGRGHQRTDHERQRGHKDHEHGGCASDSCPPRSRRAPRPPAQCRRRGPGRRSRDGRRHGRTGALRSRRYRNRIADRPVQRLRRSK